METDKLFQRKNGTHIKANGTSQKKNAKITHIMHYSSTASKLKISDR